ncbi:MAG: antibiotic biosynthesis monooxygenase [Flavipsychrobacter sp.]|nr:antibiotic biosynthesis monooxygenase [Flavipsychrobacter sp.]
MIVRIVQMTFRADKTDEFVAMFNERKDRIRHFDGCTHLELWQDKKQPEIFFTYSHWESESALDHYRFSEFFKETWGLTKAMFAAPPQAWSVEQRYDVA